MEPVIVKIKGKTSSGLSIIEEKCFRHLVEVEGYTKKKIRDKFGIGHRIWALSLNTYYTPLEIEKLRRKKIMSTRQSVKPVRWRERAKVLENFYPGIIKLVEDGNYEKILGVIRELNHLIYDSKESLRLLLKHVRHGSKRRGLKLNLVANALEYKVEKVLIELGLNYICQYPIGKRQFDFRVGKLLIEVDGRYHSERTDKVKNKLAHKKGYKLLRLKESEVKYVQIIKDKINKANRQANGI